jgi:hypothetical protein
MRSRLLISGVVATAILALVPAAAQSRSAEALTLDVNYSYAGDITVTLPSGQPVGVRSGTPTVIPAGYYTVELTQPGCVDTPAFVLQGPGVNILDDLNAGEIVTDAQEADFQPNSTYTWRDGSINPPVFFTFQTSGDVLGTPPPPSSAASGGPVSSNKEANGSVVGSGIKQTPKLSGTLAATVSAAGKPTLSFKGKRVSSLTAGRYAITVTDRSPESGFAVERSGSHAMTLTAPGFVGKRSETLELTAGRWSFLAGPSGSKTSFSVVKGGGRTTT